MAIREANHRAARLCPECRAIGGLSQRSTREDGLTGWAAARGRLGEEVRCSDHVVTSARITHADLANELLRCGICERIHRAMCANGQEAVRPLINVPRWMGLDGEAAGQEAVEDAARRKGGDTDAREEEGRKEGEEKVVVVG